MFKISLNQKSIQASRSKLKDLYDWVFKPMHAGPYKLSSRDCVIFVYYLFGSFIFFSNLIF
jgi:hypothetical protein